MFRFRRKRGKDDESSEEIGSSGDSKKGKAMLQTVMTGLNSQWFRPKNFSILKELDGGGQKRGVIDDTSRERAVISILGTLEGAAEMFAAQDDQEGLKEAADLFLMAYTKMGDPALLDRYVDVCEKIGMAGEEITGKLVETADGANQIDIAVTLYSKVKATKKLTEAGNRALSLYLEANDMDMESRSRLFHYVVEAYKAAGDEELLIQAGDKALKNQIDGRRISRDEDWVLDAQKAYEASGDKGKLTKLADQYVNLYLKEGLEVWLDKAIVVYELAEVDVSAKLGNLADKVEERGRSGMADTMRRKVGL